MVVIDRAFASPFQTTRPRKRALVLTMTQGSQSDRSFRMTPSASGFRCWRTKQGLPSAQIRQKGFDRRNA
jgi:hypothetical protein